MGETYFQTDLTSHGDALSIGSVRRRITLDLHTREILEDREVASDGLLGCTAQPSNLKWMAKFEQTFWPRHEYRSLVIGGNNLKV